MSEFWKSTPKYWCKYCSTYVRDTKLDRANHEATGKHQGAVKRSLRELHRGHEREEKEKDRARREIERLNGVVSGSSGGDGGVGPSSSAPSSSAAAGGAAPSRGRVGAYGVAGQQPPPPASAEDRQRQLEQLAGMGVSIPTELRSEMAMAGEWTVTATRVVREPGEGGEDEDSKDPAGVEGVAAGVRKRELDKTEEEKEEDEALKGLFKKQKRWGREARGVPAETDAELDALLSGSLVRPKQEDPLTAVKNEEALEEKLLEVKSEDGPRIKSEEGEDEGRPGAAQPEASLADIPAVKAEDAEASSPAAVMFKKRKPKNIRQK